MNKNELNEKLFDQILKYAAEERMDRMANDFPSEVELERAITLTPEFHKRMNTFLKKVKHKEFLLSFRKKSFTAGIIISVSFIICFSVVSNVDALRVPFLNFFNDINKQSTTIYVNDGDGLYSSFGDQIKGLYLPSYIPELYKVKSINKADKNYIAIFINPAGQIIKLRAIIGESALGVDTENADIVQLTVNGGMAQFYSKNEQNTLIFEYDNNAFILDGPITKDELINIAKSMEYII